MTPRSPIAPQTFQNGEIHDWYRVVHGYSDHLVALLLDRFNLGADDWVLDPFCGSGTTLVECMKHGVSCVGIDANPASVYASRVKTYWSLDAKALAAFASAVSSRYAQHLTDRLGQEGDSTYRYVIDSGMLDRGWISPNPLRRAVAIKRAIRSLSAPAAYKRALMLALIAEVVYGSSNIKFGPELYCGPSLRDSAVLKGFLARVGKMVEDLAAVKASFAQAKVLRGDSRNCAEPLRRLSRLYSAVISSPPYPAEHDYTRNSRLELAFLEVVSGLVSLRTIKRTMIRSNTKGIYTRDRDAILVKNQPMVAAIVRELSGLVSTKSHGFARFYPRVVSEYFGGIFRHLRSVIGLVTPGAYCAYVVGDQSCYLRVHIPTAQIMAAIANEVGFEYVSTEHWRHRWSTRTGSDIAENILILRRPKRA